jgi:hypothetical protein
MDSQRFDALSRSIAAGASRRSVLLGVTGGLLLGLPATLAVEWAEAKKKKKPKTHKFVAKQMSGDKEIPPESGDPDGSGRAEFGITKDKICGEFHYETNDPAPVVGLHIHQGSADEEGGIVVDFAPYKLDKKRCVDCPGTICKQIKNNPSGFYANIHTEDFDAGAVRAQLQQKA